MDNSHLRHHNLASSRCQSNDQHTDETCQSFALPPYFVDEFTHHLRGGCIEQVAALIHFIQLFWCYHKSLLSNRLVFRSLDGFSRLGILWCFHDFSWCRSSLSAAVSQLCVSLNNHISLGQCSRMLVFFFLSSGARLYARPTFIHFVWVCIMAGTAPRDLPFVRSNFSFHRRLVLRR